MFNSMIEVQSIAVCCRSKATRSHGFVSNANFVADRRAKRRKSSTFATIGIPHREFEIDHREGLIPAAQKPPYRQTSMLAGQFHFRIGRFSQNQPDWQAHLLNNLGKYAGFRFSRFPMVDAKAQVELETGSSRDLID